MSMRVTVVIDKLCDQFIDRICHPLEWVVDTRQVAMMIVDKSEGKLYFQSIQELEVGTQFMSRNAIG